MPSKYFFCDKCSCCAAGSFFPNSTLLVKAKTLKLADGFKANSYMLGFTVPLGASKGFSSWQHADPNNSDLTGGDENMNVYSIGYTYDLSKRTALYAYASYADNFAFQDQVSDRVVAIGLRHQF
jgi:general bacterial porin, GBP family